MWELSSPKSSVYTTDLNEIVRMVETKTPILIRKVEPGLILNDEKLNFRVLFIIKSIEPIEAWGVDLIQGKT